MRVTVEEIARIAGVSKATVSRVANNVSEGVGKETRERVQRIMDSMNYSAGRSPSIAHSMKSCSIALILPDITNPFFSDIAKAVESKARQEGYITILANTDFSEENELKLISNLISKKVDGIILVASGAKTMPEHLLPMHYGIPMILLDRQLSGDQEWQGVYSDNEYAAFCSCEMLIKNGSREIVFLSGPMGVSTSIERANGYRAALKQYACVDDPRLVKYGNYTVEAGYNAIIQLAREGRRYSAVLAGNDMMALGALNALKELNYKVPSQVELIGFDNISFSQYSDPPLSTIQQPTVEMGTKATEMLLSAINGNPSKGSIRLQPHILLRKSTKSTGI